MSHNDHSDAAIAEELAALRTSDALSAETRAALSPQAAGVLSADEKAALFDDIAAFTVDKKPSLRDRLRELSTPLRIALAVGGGLLMAAVALLITGVRADLTGQAMLRYVIAMTAIAALVGAAFAVSLRGMHHRPLGRSAWALILSALGLPLALAVTPWLWDTGAALPEVSPGGGVSACLALGLVTGALTAAVSWVFQRQDIAIALRLIAATAGGGLTAFALLQLHCPSGDATHLLLGHACVGLLLAASVAVVLRFRRA